MMRASVVLLLLMASGATVRAQIVRGRVVDQATGGALPGAHVILVDSAGHDGTSVLTTEDGRFAMRAPEGGKYAVRVQRIGYGSTRSDLFTLGAEETIEQQIAATSVSVRLDVITVNERARCAVGETEGTDVATVWEEVRKALSAATLTRSQQLVSYTLHHFERDLDPSGRNVKRERSWDNDAFGRNAFSAVKPDFLAEHGYSKKVDNETFYFAPDADVLLSPAFLQSHCLKLHATTEEGIELVGLGFAPTRDDITEVEGALWVDRHSSELRRLEFRYTGLPVRSRGPEFGGRVEYQRLPTGAWIVRDWVIRMPILTVPPRQADAQGYSLTTPYDDRRTKPTLAAVHEEGGSVLESRSIKGALLYKSGAATTAASPAPNAGTPPPAAPPR